MCKFIVGGIAIVAGVVPLAMVAPSASGAVAGAKSNPPVKLKGRVNDQGTGTATGGLIEIDQQDNAFSPTFVQIPAGATSLTVTVKNMGHDRHTFSVPTQKIDMVVKPGKSVIVTVSVPGPGAIGFSCRFHKSKGMQGAFFDKVGAKLIGATRSTPSGSNGGSKGSGGYGY
jgi:plastocyanin